MLNKKLSLESSARIVLKLYMHTISPPAHVSTASKVKQLDVFQNLLIYVACTRLKIPYEAFVCF